MTFGEQDNRGHSRDGARSAGDNTSGGGSGGAATGSSALSQGHFMARCLFDARWAMDTPAEEAVAYMGKRHNTLKRLVWVNPGLANRSKDYATLEECASMVAGLLEGHHLECGSLATHRFEAPSMDEPTWARFPTAGVQALIARGQVERAWHGGKWRRFVSTAIHGRLYESRERRLGDAFKNGRPGVYSHGDRWRDKVGFYRRRAPLGMDLMWEYMWELRVDHGDRVLKSSDDKARQQAHKARGTELCALWVRGLGVERIGEGEEVAFEWDPSKQADHTSAVWGWRARLEAV